MANETAEQWWKRVVGSTPFLMSGKNIWKRMDEFGLEQRQIGYAEGMWDVQRKAGGIGRAADAAQEGESEWLGQS